MSLVREWWVPAASLCLASLLGGAVVFVSLPCGSAAAKACPPQSSPVVSPVDSGPAPLPHEQYKWTWGPAAPSFDGMVREPAPAPSVNSMWRSTLR